MALWINRLIHFDVQAEFVRLFKTLAWIDLLMIVIQLQFVRMDQMVTHADVCFLTFVF
jgi:hypothetical protein